MTAVSVLLTSYNRSRFLPQAVESVLAQTMTDWELIILDDCSSDPGVADYLATIWHHPQVIVYKSAVREENRADVCRYAEQINTGLKLASGRCVTYLCDDDWYAPNRLEVMSAMLDAGPSIGVVYGRQGTADEAGNLTGYRDFEPVVTDAYCRVDHSSVMHTAEAGVKAGGWDDSPEHWRIADAVFWRRLHAAGYSFHRVPGDDPLDFHRFHGAGVNQLGGPYS
jgi:glycosyltransferase involved in cell wall biosynthesis